MRGSKITNLIVLSSHVCMFRQYLAVRDDIKMPTYKPYTNHKRSSVRSHTLTPTTICDFSHSLCWSPLTDLGHINSVTYVCHPLWFVCGHRKGILTSPFSLKKNQSHNRHHNSHIQCLFPLYEACDSPDLALISFCFYLLLNHHQGDITYY